MITVKSLIGAVALIAASTGFAQSSNTCSWFPKGEDGPGVIGKRYAEASFDLIDEAHTAHNTYGAGFGANLPVTEGLDVSGGYHYSWYNRTPLSVKSHNIDANATLYKTITAGVKPFISAGLGYSWQDTTLDDGWLFFSDNKNHHGQNFAFWGLTVGAEFPYKWVSVIPTITYQDDFLGKVKSTQEFVYSVEVNSWITRRVGIFVSGSYYDQQHAHSRTFGVGTGVRVRF
jgi:opacity protein-like surface antigen